MSKRGNNVSYTGTNSQGNDYTTYKSGGYSYSNKCDDCGSTTSHFYSPSGKGEGFYHENNGGPTYYQKSDGSRSYK
eukprot:m.26159 g.26159  ORF g.26159 m.26159 type:complete len:76 (-) comp9246_c1_seq1:84-311(-)